MYGYDHRHVAGHLPNWMNVDEARGTITWEDEDDEGNFVDVVVALSFDVCGTCEGRGRHVNPSIDGHGLTAEDFADDPDFAENYFRCTCDVPCYECHGQRVTPTSDDPRFEVKVAEAWSYAREAAHERAMGY